MLALRDINTGMDMGTGTDMATATDMDMDMAQAIQSP
jgi:hypothetical protein